MLHGYNRHLFVDVEKLEDLAKEYGQFIQNKSLTRENETNNRTVFDTSKFSTNEYNNFLRNKDKIDLSQIEETASYVVDNNLDRAVSAANKINKEISIKLENMSILEEMRSKLYEQSIKTEQTHKGHFHEIVEGTNFITEADKKYNKETLATEEIQKEVNVAEEIKKFETLDIQMESKLNITERKLLRQQDIEEAIETGTVHQRAEMFKIGPGNRKLLDNEILKTGCNESTSNIQLSKQRLYNLGLQIIPNILKATQFSKHGHVLFKTFLMQMTKVMIAMSRFILLDKNKYLHENCSSFLDRGEIIKKSKLSGAKIAQIEGFKPAELTNKMDIVLSEFLKKCGQEENYFEKNISSTKSRPRPDSKSNNEEIISNRVSFEPKRMIHDKKILQETYETKTNSIEIKEMKSKQLYSEFGTSKIDSEVNLYENEIKPVDDSNLIYIAIVEAHVYTNKDAIFGEKLTKMSESRYESASDLDIVYYRCEVSVTYRDFRESSVPPTVIIESIEEIPSEQVYEEEEQESQQTSVLGFEEVAKELAVQKITEVLEPLLMIKEVKSVNIKHAYPAIEMPLKTTTETTTLAMEKENNIFQTTLLTEKSHTSIEKPVKSVVETSVLSVQEDESGFVDIFKITQQKPETTIERTAKSIAETTEFIVDEKVETIDCKQQVLQTPHPIVEGSVKSVAEVTKIITDETKTNILNISNPLSVMPRYTITNNLKSVAETITTAEEDQTDILNISESMSMTPRCAIFNNLLSIAETFTATSEEPKHENLDITKLSKKTVAIGIDKNFATEVVEIFSEEPVPEEIIKVDIEERHIDEYFEKPLLILPERNTVFMEESISERLCVSEPLKKEAKINFKLRDIPVCAEVTEITFNEKEQNIFDIMSALETEPSESKEKPVLSVVAITTVLPFEPKEESLVIDKLKTQDAHVTIEESQATEIAIVRSEEPNEEKLNICKISNKWPKINIESSMLPVPVTLSVQLQEPAHEELQIPNLCIKSSPKPIKDTGLPVAESLLIVPNGPKSIDFILNDTTNEQAKIVIEESKAAIISVVDLEEPKSENLALPTVEEKKPRLSMQDSKLTLVTKEEIMPNSPNYDDLTPFMYEKDVGKPEIDECIAILTTITSYEEPKPENVEIPRITEKQFKTLIESPLLTVANTATVVPESCNDSFDTEITDEIATVKFVEIQNCETTEISAVEPKEKYFGVPIIKQQNLVTSINEVHLSTAESSLIIPEIITNTFNVSNTDKEQANIDIVENKSIETLLVHALEANHEKLEISTAAKKQPETLIERPVLVVAETTTAVPEEFCTNNFETKIEVEKAVINRLPLESCIITETTAEETIKKHVEVQVINHQRLQSDIQRVHLLSAESSITIPETYINPFETSKIESHQANISIVEQKGIEGTLVCLVEPYCVELEISTAHRNQLDILVETPTLSVVETSMDFTAESYDDSTETKLLSEKANVNFVKNQNVETIVITAEEPKEKHLEMPIIKQQSLVTSMEEVHLSTAEASLIIPEITTNTFDSRKTESYQAHKNLVEQKAVVSTLVCPLEPCYEELATSRVLRNQPETLIETAPLTVAEVSTVATVESCNDSFETKITVEKATVNIVTMHNRETTEIFVDEPKEKHLDIIIINHQSLETITQEAHLSTAESSLIIPGIAVNAFDTKHSEAQKVHVDIVEQKGIASMFVCPWEPHCDEIEISKVIKNTLNSNIETPSLIVAETLTVVPLGNCDDKFDSRIEDVQASVHVVATQNYINTETTAEGPREKNLEILIINQQKPTTYIEELYLSVAEIFTLIPELSFIYFNTNKIEIQQIHISMIEQKSIGIFLIFPFEPNLENLEILKVTANQTETSIDSSYLKVAEIFVAISEEPRYESFETKLACVQAIVNVVAFKTYETTEISTEESKEKILEISATNPLQLHTEIEDMNLSVAEWIVIVPEISVNIFDTKKPKSQQVYIQVIEQKSVETFMLCRWEANYEELKISKVTSIQPEILIESPVLIVAEILTTIPEGPYIDNLKIKIIHEQAEVNIVAILLPEISKIIAEEPKEMIFEIPIVNKLKLQVGFEEIYLLSAESFLLLPDESLDIFQLRKMERQNVLIDVVEQKAITIFFIVVWEQNYKDLEVQEIIKKVPHTLIVSSILTVAENLTFVFEEKVQEGLKSIKSSLYQATTNFERLKVALKHVVFSEEPRQEIFDRPKLFMLEPQLSVVDKYLTVAEVQTILPIEPREKIFETTEITSQYADFEIEECKTAVSSIIFIAEPNIEEFITKGLITNEPENLVDITAKMIAQVTAITMCEKEVEFSVSSQAGIKKVNIGVEALKPVAQKFLIFTEDSQKDVCEYCKFLSYQAKTTVIEAAATAVAQTTIPNVAKHQLQKLTKAIERKHEVDISEIVDTNQDVKNIDSIDVTKYNVELANDYEESFTMQEEKVNYSKDIDFASLSSASSSSSISSAPSSPLIEVYVFGVKGHEYRVQSPQETSLDITSTHVDSAYKIQNIDTSMTIAIEASIDKFEDMRIEKEEVYDIAVKKQEYMISDMEINESMESADVNINKIKSNMSLETESYESQYHSFQDLETRSALITKNRALSYDQAADFDVGLQSVTLKAKDNCDSDSQAVAKFDMQSEASFKSVNVQSTEANLNIKMKSAKTMTAENIHVTCGLTIGNEIIDFDKSMDLSVQASKESKTAKTSKRQIKKGAAKQISLEKSESLSLGKSESVKESYGKHEEETKDVYGLEETSLSETSSAMEDKLESNEGSRTSYSSAMYSSAIKQNLDSQSILLGESTRSIEMAALGQTGLTGIATQITNDAQSPSPPTVPSTPLTDYYMFSLQSPYPEETTFVPRDCSFSPESVDEDSLVITSGLIPHIDTKIERILYSPPLQTPDTSPERHSEVILTELERKSVAQRQKYTKEEIKDIGKKSSLLASDIDKTIRSVEEYKESVGISAKKAVETKGLNRLDVQKVELSSGRQYTQATNAGQLELSVADANESFVGASETKVKGLKRKTVTHKGLATSISGEQSVAETHQSRESDSQSDSIQLSGSKSSSIKLSGIQSKSIQSSSRTSSSGQSSGIQLSSSKSGSSQSSNIQTRSIQSSGIRTSTIQSTSGQPSDVKSSSSQLSDSKSSSSQLSGIQSSAIQLSGIQSGSMQSRSIKSRGGQSSSSQLSGVKSTNESGSGQSSDIQSSAIQSSGIQSSSAKSSSFQLGAGKSRSIQSSTIQSSDVQSSGIQSSGVKSSGGQSSGIQSHRIQSTSTKSSSSQLGGAKSGTIQSSGIQSSSSKSSSVQSSSSKWSAAKSSSVQSSEIQSSGSKSSGVKSISSQLSSTQASGGVSSSGKSSSSKSSSTNSDQKLHLLSRFS